MALGRAWSVKGLILPDVGRDLRSLYIANGPTRGATVRG